uniref:Uncharacterized protein n=1 Tax=Oryza sativa subsp. japonica TaxID=39947 RepID=Q84R28_ORYSJ|nr:hypothetical protein [Oryza sativa Japonica Group]
MPTGGPHLSVVSHLQPLEPELQLLPSKPPMPPPPFPAVLHAPLRPCRAPTVSPPPVRASASPVIAAVFILRAGRRAHSEEPLSSLLPSVPHALPLPALAIAFVRRRRSVRRPPPPPTPLVAVTGDRMPPPFAMLAGRLEAEAEPGTGGEGGRDGVGSAEVFGCPAAGFTAAQEGTAHCLLRGGELKFFSVGAVSERLVSSLPSRVACGMESPAAGVNLEILVREFLGVTATLPLLLIQIR